MDQNDLTKFNTSTPKDNTELCQLILIGLEGVGKTTLINEACGEHFDTSDGRNGCSVKEDQKGSFLLDGFFRRYQLIDMLGINYKNPGEWQRTLHGRSQVHGVIFFLNGSNPRDSALGELPRISEYCSSLGIPVRYIYRDGLLRFKPSMRIYTDTKQIDIEDDETKITMSKTVFDRYKNLDEVKRIIAQTFEHAEILHPLLDPITICGHVKELRDKNEGLETKVKALNQKYQEELIAHKNAVDKQKKEYDDQISQLNQSLDKAGRNIKMLQETIERISRDNQDAVNQLGNKIQVSIVENQRLQLLLGELSKAKIDLEEKYSQLNEDKCTLDTNFRTVSQEREELKSAKVKLQGDIAELKEQTDTLDRERRLLANRKECLERRVNKIKAYLETKLASIVKVVQSTSDQRPSFLPKKYNAGQRWMWMWLPGQAYEVIEQYDAFGKDVNDVIRTLRHDLQLMGNSSHQGVSSELEEHEDDPNQ